MSNKKWLDAFHDPLTALYTFNQCCTLSDLQGDADPKLVVADLGTGSIGMKLKAFKNSSIFQQTALSYTPACIASVYMDNLQPRVPSICAASGGSVFVYKNMKAYFKFLLPGIELNPKEDDAWRAFSHDEIDFSMLHNHLAQLRQEAATEMTVRSLNLLQYMGENQEKAVSYAHQMKTQTLKRATVITCMSLLYKSVIEDDAISCLVIGTEHRGVFVVDPQAFSVLSHIVLPGVPAFIATYGIYDVDFRIAVATRDGRIFQIKKGLSLGKTIQLDAHVCGLLRTEKHIIAALVNQTIVAFSPKGVARFTVSMPAAITTISLMDYRTRGQIMLVVCLENKEVRFYRDKTLVDRLVCDDVITCVRFGRYGREDNSLLMVTRSGGLMCKLLRRTANFDNELSLEANEEIAGAPIEQSVKLNIPKRTKLFVDQLANEKAHCVEMHQAFQADLFKLRLQTTRNFVQTLKTGMSPVSVSAAEPITLHAEVHGFGPVFRLTIGVQNCSASSILIDYLLVLVINEQLYKADPRLVELPLILPGFTYTVQVNVQALQTAMPVAGSIKAIVTKRSKATNPTNVTAVINMPVSEPNLGA